MKKKAEKQTEIIPYAIILEALKGNIKLVLFGAGCTNEYAEKSSDVVLSLIRDGFQKIREEYEKKFERIKKEVKKRKVFLIHPERYTMLCKIIDTELKRDK